MRARVLIVEDEIEIAELISLYLKREGIEVTQVESGEDGLQKLEKEAFDLAVLDINLPGIDGFEFLQAVRKKSAIPVVIVSARDTDEDMVLGLGIGADDFVTKPFSPKVLAARVRAHLRRFLDSQASAKKFIRFGPFNLDLEGYALQKEGERIPAGRGLSRPFAEWATGSIMKFRTKLIFLVVGVIIIPILVTAMVGYLRWLISSSDPSLSPAGFFEIRRWILEDLPEELKEGYSASLRSSLPPKPGVIVFDLEGRNGFAQAS